MVSGAAFLLDRPFWEGIRSEAIIVLGVMAGAVLFRLGRGLPPLEINYLGTEEAKAITLGLEEASKRLAYMVLTITIAIAALTVLLVLFDLVGRAHTAKSRPAICRLLSAIVAIIILFVLIRGFALIKGDLSLIRLQGRLAREAVTRRHAQESDKALQQAARNAPLCPSRKLRCHHQDRLKFQQLPDAGASRPLYLSRVHTILCTMWAIWSTMPASEEREPDRYLPSIGLARSTGSIAQVNRQQHFGREQYTLLIEKSM